MLVASLLQWNTGRVSINHAFARVKPGEFYETFKLFDEDKDDKLSLKDASWKCCKQVVLRIPVVLHLGHRSLELCLAARLAWDCMTSLSPANKTSLADLQDRGSAA